MSRIIVVVFVVVCWIEFASGIGIRTGPAPPNTLTADCNPTQRRARLLCPCLLTPSTNNGVPIPCGVTGSFCLAYNPSLASIGIVAPPKGAGVCQCGAGFTRNAASNTCSQNLNIAITPSPLVVACGVLLGANVANIVVTGGTAPFDTFISVVSSGNFPGNAQNAPLYLELDPNNKLSIVAANPTPNDDITQCYAVSVTDAAGAFSLTTFCALIETTIVCPRPIRGFLSTRPIVVGPNARTGDIAGILTGSGGSAPYTFTALTVEDCSDSPGVPSGCNNYLTLSLDGTLVVPSSPTPALISSPVTECYTATVTDSAGSVAIVDRFCAQISTPA